MATSPSVLNYSVTGNVVIGANLPPGNDTSTPLLLGDHALWPERSRSYSTLSAVEADFGKSGPIRAAAAALLSPPLTGSMTQIVPNFRIGRREASYAYLKFNQLSATKQFVLDVNGTEYTFLGGSVQKFTFSKAMVAGNVSFGYTISGDSGTVAWNSTWEDTRADIVAALVAEANIINAYVDPADSTGLTIVVMNLDREDPVVFTSLSVNTQTGGDLTFSTSMGSIADFAQSVAQYLVGTLGLTVTLRSILSISEEFVASNVINGKVNGTAISPVTYATSSDNTMSLLKTELDGETPIGTCTVVGTGADAFIIVEGGTTSAPNNPYPLQLTDFVVTGGIRQPTITTTTCVLKITVSATDNWYLAPGSAVSMSMAWESTEAVGDALDAILAESTAFYYVAPTQAIDEDNQSFYLALNTWVEDNDRIAISPQFITQPLSSGDVDSACYDLSLDATARIMLIQHMGCEAYGSYNAANATVENWNGLLQLKENIGADIVGRIAPKVPGSYVVAQKPVPNSSPDDPALTESQVSALLDRNANYHGPFGAGFPEVIWNGKLSSGQFEDTIRFTDWLKTNIVAAIGTVLANSDKVPYTNNGAQVLANAGMGVMRQAEANNAIVAGTSRCEPVPVDDIDPALRAQRVYNGLRFYGTLANGIQTVDFTVYLTN